MPESQAKTIKDIFKTYYNVPVKYSNVAKSQSYVFSNDHMVQNWYHATRYNWVCYGFSSGHMQNSIIKKHLPFDISYFTDPNPAGQDLLAQPFTSTYGWWWHHQRYLYHLPRFIR